MDLFTAFRIQKRETRPRMEILEGTVDVKGRTYYDRLFFYLRVTPGFIKLDTSRDFDGDRLIQYFCKYLGPSSGPPRIETGGRMDEEEGAFICVDWQFPASELSQWKQRLNGCLMQEVFTS